MSRIIVFSFFLLVSTYTFAQEVGSSDVRDPTAPLNYVSTKVANGQVGFTLNSILVSPQRKVAIINGSALREGQIVPGSNDVKVQKISSQAVVLQQTNKTWVLTLAPSVVKRH